MVRMTLDSGILRPMTDEEIEDQDARVAGASNTIVPSFITIGQGKEALYNAGLFGMVQPAIDAIEDKDTRWRVQNAWDNRPTWERNSPFVIMMLGVLGLSEDQADQLFIDAGKL